MGISWERSDDFSQDSSTEANMYPKSWKTTFTLKWPLFRKHVSLVKGCNQRRCVLDLVCLLEAILVHNVHLWKNKSWCQQKITRLKHRAVLVISKHPIGWKKWWLGMESSIQNKKQSWRAGTWSHWWISPESPDFQGKIRGTAGISGSTGENQVNHVDLRRCQVIICILGEEKLKQSSPIVRREALCSKVCLSKLFSANGPGFWVVKVIHQTGYDNHLASSFTGFVSLQKCNLSTTALVKTSGNNPIRPPPIHGRGLRWLYHQTDGSSDQPQ